MRAWCLLVICAGCSSESAAPDAPAPIICGHDMPYAAEATMAAGSIQGIQLAIPADGTLKHVGMITSTGGFQVVLGLYTNVLANGVEQPQMLVAQSAASVTTAGKNELPAGDIAVTAGTYWLVGGFLGDGGVGIDSATPDHTVDVFQQSVATLPAMFPSPALLRNQDSYNFYLELAR